MRKRRVFALLLALSLVVSGNGMTVLAAEQGVAESALMTEDESGTEGKSETLPTESETTVEGEKPGEIDPSAPKEESGETTNPEEEGNGTEEQKPVMEEPDSSVSENDAVPDTEEPEENTEEPVAAVRMMTFTDNAGLQITYDANAAKENAELVTIQDGVLTGIQGTVSGVVDLREKDFTVVGDSAFKGKTGITYVMLPKTVESIGTSAFEECVALKGVSIPSRLKTIGASAFKGCKVLTQLAIPNSVTSIGANAFNGDSRMFMLNMVSAEYSKLTTIGDSAFEDCSSLELFCSDEEYNLPDSITTIGNRAFYGCVKIDKVDMGDDITSLGESAYQGCSGIKGVTISARIKTVPQYAFADCTKLIELEFSTKVRGSVTIESYAFQNCSKLGSLDLPQKVSCVKANAFGGCTALRRIYIGNDDADLEKAAFPNENPDLCIIGSEDSEARDYAKNNGNLRFISSNESDSYYTYTQKLTGPTANGKIQLKVTNKKGQAAQEFSKVNDINSIVNSDGIGGYNKGVKAGTDCYVIINYSDGCGSYIGLVSGSLKCNGVTIKEDASKEWVFKMPAGGATITAEFDYIESENTLQGNKDTVEGRLSSDVNYDYQRNIGYMKVGQSTKFYLTNAGTRIPASKVKYRVSQDYAQGVVSVDAQGNVKALKEGMAIVEADVTIEGVKISVEVAIVVESIDIDHISVLLPGMDKKQIEYEADGRISGVSIPTTDVTKEYKFTIKATAFSSVEDDERMDVPFTWESSDVKVAKVSKASTTAASSENTIIIPKGTDGEATITVSATGADKKKRSQKFVISVQDYEPRLNAAKITVNPNQVDGTTTIGIIDAYGNAVDNDEIIEAYDAKSGQKVPGFKFTFAKKEGVVSTYKVSALPGMKQQTYNVKLKIKVETVIKPYEPSLAIVIKESSPNPTVSFDSKKPKINLFYANDGTEIEPIIGRLDGAVVSEYSLEPLTEPGNKNYEDDAKFTENFEIVTNDEGKAVIKQKASSLLCNKSKKPVVTGYLVLKFKDYKEDLVKKYKITIPTQTVAPVYMLDKTANTFSSVFRDEQTVYLQLLDKKTKQPIDLHPVGVDEENPYKLEKLVTSTTNDDDTTCTIVEDSSEHDGMIQVKLKTPDKGKLVMRLTNSTWADDKSFTYTYQINTDTRAPKISLKTPTVTLNTSYPEQEIGFELVSNHYNTLIDETQAFIAPTNLRADVQQQYGMLEVEYEDGVGKVRLTDANIKPGTYRFTCDVYQKGARFMTNSVTLNVKVTKTIPTVALKGTNSFNLMAYTDVKTYAGVKNEEGSDTQRKFIEKSEMTLEPKNLPAAYTLDAVSTLNTIECTTKGYERAVECFDFRWEDGKLEISMNEDAQDLPPKTYAFKILPTYSYSYENENGDPVVNSISPAKPVTFTIKVYSGAISVKLGAKGKINLVDRSGSYTEKNGIRYTPTFANLKDTLSEVRVLDAGDDKSPVYSDETRFSREFEAHIAEDGKSFFIVPKAGVELENKKTYQLRIWMQTEGYVFPSNGGGIYAPGVVKVTTAEVLPKVKTDKTAVDLYLSSKSYETSFVVTKADVNAVGDIESIAFGENDTKADGSFAIRSEQQTDGSLKVYLKLKNTVSYGCNTTNRITMYIKFKNQGTNTAGTAVNMNVKINK